jgi:hypothetical protein
MSILIIFFMLNISIKTATVGAGATSSYGTGSSKIMWLLAALALQKLACFY